MEANVNLYCVATELVRLVEEHFLVDKSETPKASDTAVAQLLFNNLGDITCDYTFHDEEENDFGGGK